MMISVLYFLRYCQYDPGHLLSGSGPWPDGSQSPLPETLMALNEEHLAGGTMNH